MRTVSGDILLPANAPTTKAGQMVVEVRDVSLADAPSVVIAEQQMADVQVRPHGRIPFRLAVPEVAANRSLSVRVHVSMDGSGRVQSGDLLTTASYPVANVGDVESLVVRVNSI